MLNLPEVLNSDGRPRRLERGGWASIDRVLEAIGPSYNITRDDLSEIVRSSDKQRLGISSDGLKIRANQGHSCEVDMECAS
jgi:putative RNA 2'-phosphotransferase